MLADLQLKKLIDLARWHLGDRGGGSGVKNDVWLSSKISMSLNHSVFTECQNFILLKSYYNFNFGNLVGSLMNFRTKMKF